ncbi:hypothetical protein M9458_033572, partial [Cirrhinus mrigala]
SSRARVQRGPVRSNLLEQQLSPGPAVAALAAAAAASDATGGQTPNQELQSPHTRIKKKFEELKKRYDLEKE